MLVLVFSDEKQAKLSEPRLNAQGFYIKDGWEWGLNTFFTHKDNPENEFMVILADKVNNGNPFETWCCGFQFERVEIFTKDLKISDLLYLIGRVRSRTYWNEEKRPELIEAIEGSSPVANISVSSCEAGTVVMDKYNVALVLGHPDGAYEVDNSKNLDYYYNDKDYWESYELVVDEFLHHCNK